MTPEEFSQVLQRISFDVSPASEAQITPLHACNKKEIAAKFLYVTLLSFDFEIIVMIDCLHT